MNTYFLLALLISLILTIIKHYITSKKYSSLIDRVLSYFRKNKIDAEDFIKYLLNYKATEKVSKDIEKKKGK